MTVQDALGFEVLLSAAKLDVAERLLLTEEGVFGAEGEAELHEPGADYGEQTNKSPRDRGGGASTWKAIGG